MSKQTKETPFYPVYRNIPYTDEEWECQTLHRKKLLDEPLAHRPNHSYKWGKTAYSHEEAREFCEEALRAGAQFVSYAGAGEKWVCGRDYKWTCVKYR